ncbi:MAG: STAS domain-containing protein [Proteobacteria bacterium]|jgi:anti-anti-sigma factor|nr:STAS domain-containing protein [Pseudomonadota bacterium]MDA1299174.1 STAS domain-containing protein [Pseudomonadota bacterium]
MSKILYTETDGVFVLKFVGDVRVTLGPTISTFLEKVGHSKSFRAVVLDLTETEALDSTTLGMLAKISLRTQAAYGHKPTLFTSIEDVTRTLQNVGFEDVFVIVDGPLDGMPDMLELPQEIVSEANLRDQVLEAHRILMTLNKKNHRDFKDLVAALEEEQAMQVSRAVAKQSA